VAGRVEDARETGTQSEAVIRAAGGVVARETDTGVEVLVVHRPKYDDWTFPKGKAEPGESDDECALREVEEETGLRCGLDRELPSTSYVDGHGRPKRVRYWLMQPAAGELVFANEVDDAVWVAPEEARGLLSYERDLGVLDSLGTDPLT
jgi:8-oxo-dGTP pyrophosphatase MutT (NUDIX family)